VPEPLAAKEVSRHDKIIYRAEYAVKCTEDAEGNEKGDRNEFMPQAARFSDMHDERWVKPGGKNTECGI